MEITPSKKFEKTNNIIHNYSLNSNKNTSLAVITQEEPIKAKAYIDAKHKIFYSSTLNHKALKKMGIPAYLNDPLIVLTITDLNNKKLILPNHKNKPITLDFFMLPVAYLHSKKTNDVIELKLYNHPVQIKCINDPKTTNVFSDFNDEFDTQKELFQFKARYTRIVPVTLFLNKSYRIGKAYGIDQLLIENQIIRKLSSYSFRPANKDGYFLDPLTDPDEDGYFFDIFKNCGHGKNGYKFRQIATNILKHKQDDNPYTLNDKQNIFNILKDRETNGSFVNKHNIHHKKNNSTIEKEEEKDKTNRYYNSTYKPKDPVVADFDVD